MDKLREKLQSIIPSLHPAQVSKPFPFKGDYKRVYHYHIRKTAGASLNFAFWAYSGEHPGLVQRKLPHHSKRYRANNGLIFVGGNPQVIAEGNYFFARAHNPAHRLNIPPGTFTVTIFRDPVSRTISHYKMLLTAIQNEKKDAQSFGIDMSQGTVTMTEFLNKIPPKHLKRQLYMFSENFNSEEAFENVNSLCSYYFFTEEFSSGLLTLGKILGIELKEYHHHKNPLKPDITDAEMDRLREELQDEYNLIEMLRAEHKNIASKNDQETKK
jgi:hypothetical protein